jgi:hypothetical protein
MRCPLPPCVHLWSNPTRHYPSLLFFGGYKKDLPPRFLKSGEEIDDQEKYLNNF